MAAEIGVSPSYLNHLERNQRPVTAQVLLRLAEAYDVDLKSFAAEGGEGTGAAQLAEIFADPMFGGIARAALRAGRGRGQCARRSPTRSRASTRRWSSCAGSRAGERGRRARRCSARKAWVRDHIQAERNHFPYLEEAAETLAGALGDPLDHRRAAAAAAEGGVRHRGADRAARSCSTAPASITTCTASG